MIVFLKNIPPSTREQDIIDFFQPVIKKGLLTKKGEIGNIQMLVIKDNDTQIIEHHGLVHIEPDKTARKAITKLNKHLFLGRKIEVREYFYRSWHNDRRIHNQPPNYVLINERRNDRRRNNLEKLTVTANNQGKFEYDFF